MTVVHLEISPHQWQTSFFLNGEDIFSVLISSKCFIVLNTVDFDTGNWFGKESLK